MSAWELALWRALERVDPWGQTRQDAHFAHLCSVIANGLMKKEDKTAFQPSDFVLDFLPKEAPEPPSAKSLESAFAAYAKAHNEAYRKRVAEEEKQKNQKRRSIGPPRTRKRPTVKKDEGS